MPLNRCFSKRKKGMSLIEIIVSVALFGLFSIVAVSFITSSVRSYARGQITHKLKDSTSDAITKMKEDINRAYILPSFGSPDAWVPSGILVPNPYGDSNGAASGDSNTGKSTDRLVVAVNTLPIKSANLYGNIGDYQFIEYIVNSADKNKLHRVIYYNLSSSASGYSGFEPLSGHWLFKDSGLSSLSKKDEVIIELPGPKDEITFVVQRPALVAQELSNPYGVKYNPYVVHISLNCKSFYRNDTSSPIEYVEQTDAQQLMR